MWKGSLLTCVIFLQLFTYSWNLTQYVDLGQPITLRKDVTNIMTISFIQDGSNSYHFYAAFSDGGFRAYLEDYSSYWNFTTYSVVSKVVGSSFGFAHSLSNGSNYNYETYVVTALSIDGHELTNYVYGTQSPIVRLLLAQSVLAFKTMALPTNSSGIIAPFNVVICTDTIFFHRFEGPIVNLNSISSFRNGTSAVAAAHYKTDTYSNGNTLTFVQIFAITISDGSFLSLTVNINYQYTNGNYVFQSSSSSFFEEASSMLFTPDQIIVFDSFALLKLRGTFDALLYDMENHQFIQLCPDNPVGQIYQIISYNGFVYLVQNNGVIQTYFETSVHLGYSKTVLSLPDNTYDFVIGQSFNILYVPDTSDVFKVGYCINMSVMVNGVCANYNCYDSNCDSCLLSEHFCTDCTAGWISNDKRKCEVDLNYTNSSLGNTSNPTPANTSASDNSNVTDPTMTNTTNVTNAATSNNTNNSATTSNSSTPSNMSNSTSNVTNATSSNSTSNQTNNSSSFSANSSITILTNNSYLSNVFHILDSQSAISLFQILLNVTKMAISIPGGRKIISPIFYYFGNFDDLFLYERHFREYGRTVTYFFNQIDSIQRAKWSLLNYIFVFQIVTGQSESIENTLVYQDEYLEPIEGEGSEGIMANSMNFFFTSTPIVIITFLVFRVLFKVLFRFRFSKMLRKFDFWGYFLIVIFEGNIQQFAFSLMAQLKHSFVFNLTSKMIKMFIIYFGFAIILLSFGGYLIGKITYRKLNSYLLQNQFNSLRGNTAILLQNGIRNFILGCFHYWLRFYNYEYLIASLLTVELSFNLYFIYSMSDRIYKGKWNVWLYLLLNFVRFLLIMTLAKDHRDINQFYIEIIQTALILIMILLYVFCIFVGVIELGRQAKQKWHQIFSQKQQAKKKATIASTFLLRHSNTFDNLGRIKKNKPSSQLKRAFTIDRKIYTIIQIE